MKMKWFNWNSTSKRLEELDYKYNVLNARVSALEEARAAHLEIMKNQSKQLLILSELVLKGVMPPKLKKD